MTNKVKPFSCMDDCIHLHACRRIQAIGRKFRLNVPRYCSEDCSCYLSLDDMQDWTAEEILSTLDV